MNLTNLLTFNSATNLAIGIAFTLYAPIMMGYFSVPDAVESPLAFWQVAAFARLLGATMMGLGLLLLSVRGMVVTAGAVHRRGIIFAMLLANLLGMIVIITQQLSVWQSLAGWIAALLFSFFTLGYGYFYVRNQRSDF